MIKYPLTRKRRNRYTDSVRNLVRENNLTANDLIWPVFVLEGKERKEEIKSMPGVFRLSVDLLLKRLDELHDLGLNAVALFPVVTEDKKSIDAQ
ncbi:MAG: porphobilinogen synthase, partial [Proteobacteria bacterium]|nr:porphobilinogen synthase [Pseudomonadota bacterium]